MNFHNEEELKETIEDIVKDYKLEKIIYKRPDINEIKYITKFERIVFSARKKDDIDGRKYAIKADLVMGNREIEKKINNMLKDDKTKNLDKCKIIEGNNITCYISKLYNGGDLDNYIKKLKSENKQFKIEEIIFIMKNILNGLEKLHKMKIIHRDIKPKNLLINYEDEKNPDLLKSCIVIIDYGLAKIISSIDDKKLNNKKVGTPYYMHPLFSSGKKNMLNEELDIWSLGITCMELLHLEKFKLENGTYFIPYNNNTSIELVRFIDQMLQEKENNQAKIDKILKDDFLNRPIKNFHPFRKCKCKGKIITKENIKYLELNYNCKNKLNFDYDEIIKDEDIDIFKDEIDKEINKCFIDINELFLFTEPVLFPIIADINDDDI